MIHKLYLSKRAPLPREIRVTLPWIPEPSVMGHIGTLVDEFGIIGTYSLAPCPQCFCMFSKFIEAIFILFSEKK
jgi:hypothetical protein